MASGDQGQNTPMTVFPLADDHSSGGGEERTSPYRGSRVWGLAGNHPSPYASCAEAAWTARSVTGQVLFLRQRPDAVLAARELADACGPHKPINLSLPLPCAESAGAGKGGRWSTVRCWSPRHTTSRAQEGGPTTRSTWTRDGRRRQTGSLVGFAQARHPHSRQKRGGFPSPGTPHVPASRDA